MTSKTFLQIIWILGLFSGSLSQNIYQSNNVPSKEELAQTFPYLLKGLNRKELTDPLRILKSIQSLNDQEVSEKTFDLNLDFDVNPKLFEHIETIVDNDHHGIIENYIREIDPKGELVRGKFDIIIFVLKYIVAPITPVFTTNLKCIDQSMNYLYHLVVNPTLWAYKMLDSTGKLPDGILSDVTSFCDYLDYFISPDICDNNTIEILFDKPVPTGNTKAMGSFHECIQVRAERSAEDLIAWESFSGRYVYQYLAYVNLSARIEQNIFENVPEIDQLHILRPKTLLPSHLNEPNSRMPSFPGIIAGSIPKALEQYYLDEIDAGWGQCIPSACTEEDVLSHSVILNKFIYKLNAAAIPAVSETEETQEEIKDIDWLSACVIALYSIIAFVMLIGTTLDGWQQFYPNSFKKRKPSGDDNDAAEEDLVLVAALKCFSVTSNGRKLLSTSSGGSDHLGCLSGIRFISMLWVILGHVYLLLSILPLKNPKLAEDVYLGRTESSYELILNALPAVDTFFFMSGLLVAYLSFIEMSKNRFNIIQFYIHRYIRLTIPLFLAICFNAGILYLIGSGPLWSILMNGYTENCRHNGWRNILYIHNFWESNTHCMGVTWYLAVDMQLFVFSPLVLYPLYYWNKKYIGYIVSGAIFLASTATIIALTAVFDLPPTHIFINYAAIAEEFNMEHWMYMMPTSKIQVYVIGMIMGYVLFKTKGKEVKIPWYVNILLWAISIATGLAVVFGLDGVRRSGTFVDPAYNMAESILYNALHKVAWGLSLSWVVFACVKGYGGLINSFLSWGPFLSLARITFVAYLLHFDFLMAFVGSFTYTIELSDFIVTIYYIGLTCMILGISFVASLTIEAPFISLEKLILKKIRPSSFNEKRQENKSSGPKDHNALQDTESIQKEPLEDNLNAKGQVNLEKVD